LRNTRFLIAKEVGKRRRTFYCL